MRLTDILKIEHIKSPMTAGGKNEAIAELIDLLAADNSIADRQKMLEAVLERERTRTTGIGGGLALPHGKAAAAGELVMALGKPAAPIDFDSVDGEPVGIVILLVSPLDRTGPHIQALARIARLMTIDSFKKRLMAASDPRDIYTLIKEQEAAEA